MSLIIYYHHIPIKYTRHAILEAGKNRLPHTEFHTLPRISGRSASGTLKLHFLTLFRVTLCFVVISLQCDAVSCVSLSLRCVVLHCAALHGIVSNDIQIAAPSNASGVNRVSSNCETRNLGKMCVCRGSSISIFVVMPCLIIPIHYVCSSYIGIKILFCPFCISMNVFTLVNWNYFELNRPHPLLVQLRE